MAYIGKTPIVGNFQKCDAITVVNGQAAYTLQVSSTNVVPESANHMLVSLNGILQAPVTSFTVSGSTLTFASNLATGDVIDFVILLGNVLDLGTVSDGTISTAKIVADAVTEAKIADDAVESEHLNNNIISGQTALGAEPADTDEFLVSDAGTIKRVDYSYIKGGGITEVDQWRLSANVSSTGSSSFAYITSNWERVDTDSFQVTGTGLSESSGVFSFPSTGKYLITFHMNSVTGGDNQAARINLDITTDNSSYSTAAHATSESGSATYAGTMSGQHFFDVTNTTNDKFKFAESGGGGNLTGDTSLTRSGFTCIRLGDT